MTPSDALARLAGILHRAQGSPSRLADFWRWMEEIERSATALSEPYRAWEFEGEDLFRTPDLAAVPWDSLSDFPRDFEEFSTLLQAVQALDRWHRPVVQSSDDRRRPQLASHKAAAKRLRTDWRFGGDDNGSIIPAVVYSEDRAVREAAHELRLLRAHPRDASRTTPDRPHPGKLLIPSVLQETTYLPATVEAQNPDADGRVVDRTVRVTYLRPKVPRNARTKIETIAVIPLLERKADLELRLTTDNSSYGVRLQYPVERLEQALVRAIEGGAELILFPETSVRETDLDALKAMIRSEAAASQQRTGNAARLRYVWVGVAGDAGGEGRHRNFAVLLDVRGNELARQHKMFRWDITADQLTRFGLDTALRLIPPSDPNWRLRENIEIADELQVVDLPDIGRTFTMICADMNYNLPGDWVSDQLRIDWLHAPIMDQFLPRIVGATPMVGTWICQRSHRAAFGGRGLVMVTNSMALTGWLNAQNEASGSRYPEVDPCGIGIFIDATGDVPTCCHVAAPFGDDAADTPIVEFREWNNDWAPLDDPDVGS